MTFNRMQAPNEMQRAPKLWEETFGGLEGLRQALQTASVFSIRFKKVNGEIREMVSTLYAPFINRHTTPSTPKLKKISDDPFVDADREERRAELYHTNLSVFDVEKKAWRSMKVENIESVNPANIVLDA